MTDKQIIDEIDVSKCKYNNNGWCLLSESCDAIRYRPCGDMTFFDCYYRNWQRKEQECEELKKVNEEKNELLAKLGCPTIATARMKVLCLQDQLKQAEKLKQALTEIKEIAEANIGRFPDGSIFARPEIEQILEKCEVIDERI